MKAYISVDHESRKKLSKEFIALGMALSGANVEQYIYVDKYAFEDGQEAEQMQKALLEIDSSNFIIIEATHINVNSCVEAGYAKAKRKPILCIQHEDSKVSPVLHGISNFLLIYDSPKNLFDQMAEFLKNILPQP